jgi:DNA-binding Lrp family transcriptional regulator
MANSRINYLLDVKDQAILSDLSLNARAGLSSLAETTALSRQVISYRLDNLEEKGVIENYYTILNIFKLGFLYHRIAFRFRNVSPEIEGQIVEFFMQHKNVGWVCQLDGDLDLAIAVWTRTIVEFENVLHESLNRIGDYIEEKRISIATKIHHLKYKFLSEKPVDLREMVVSGEIEESLLSEIDYNILGILTKTPRKTNTEIGKLLNIRPQTVNYRIKNLQEQGIILGFNLKLNLQLLGYTHYKIYLNLANIPEPEFTELINYLKSLRNTIYITKPLGMADLEFELLAQDAEECHRTIKELRYRFPELIRSVSTIVFRNERYINYLPLKK